MVTRALSTWLPDRAPTWTDVGVAVLAVVWLVQTFGSLETISWEWVAVGFVLFVVATGTVAGSAVGAWIGNRFRDLGVGGRTIAIVLFALGVWIAKSTFAVPTRPVTGVAGGIMIAVPVFVLGHALYSGEVAGWRST